MKLYSVLAVLVLGLLFQVPFAVAAEHEVVIATWNIANFAPANLEEKIDALVYLIQEHQIDLLALQEVTHNTTENDTPIETNLTRRLGGVDRFDYVQSFQRGEAMIEDCPLSRC